MSPGLGTLREQSYTRDDLDREAIVVHNCRVILEQGGSVEDVADTLVLSPAEAADLLVRAGFDPPCPACGRPRTRSRGGLNVTCGSRSCVAVLANRSRRGRPRAPHTPEARAKLSAALRRSWADPDRRARTVASLRWYWDRPESHAVASAAAQRTWAPGGRRRRLARDRTVPRSEKSL